MNKRYTLNEIQQKYNTEILIYKTKYYERL